MKKITSSKNYILLTLLLGIGIFLFACNTDSQTSIPPPKPKIAKVIVPKFNKDSAYYYIQKQVDFGYRVPGTPEHKACADWLEQKLRSYTADVTVQTATLTGTDGRQFPMYNVIASFEPQQKKRILLCAHWDSRAVADKDSKRTDEPIVGANDGGSGVGVLIEIARQLKLKPANVGVDIVLFDVEDQGIDNEEDSYALGSQYWSKNPHKAGYTANYGILLDMVGASGATFLQELYSLEAAPKIVRKVWKVAKNLGYESYFPNVRGGAIADDHLYVNRDAKIPTVDIIHYTRETGFGDFHHTHKDNMNLISKSTLYVVGHTVLTLVYSENPPL